MRNRELIIDMLSGVFRGSDRRRNIAAIVTGPVIYAFGVKSLLVSNGLSDGGIAGISTLFYFLFEIPLWILYFTMNIPIFLIGWSQLGGKFAFKTLLAVCAISFFIFLFSNVNIYPGDILITCFLSGILIGTGRGILFINGYTTGGTDIIAFVIFRQMGVPRHITILIIDVIVMGLFAWFINLDTALYSVLSLYFGSRFLKWTLEAKRIGVKANPDEKRCAANSSPA